MNRNYVLLAAFLGGVVAGGVLGLLFAPQSGNETRRKIIDALKKKGINLSEEEVDELLNEPRTKNETENTL